MRTRYELDLNDWRLEVVLERRRGMRRLILRRTGADRVFVRAPAKTARAAIDAFVRAHEGWLRAQPPGETPEAGGEEAFPASIRYFGALCPVIVCGFSGIDRVEETGSALTVYTRRKPDPICCRRLLDGFLKEKLHTLLCGFIRAWSVRIGVEGVVFTIADQKKRSGYLGKCFVNENEVRFKNWLSALTSDQIEYVVVHELCHFIEPSHSSAFKALLTRFLPGWEALHRQTVTQQK